MVEIQVLNAGESKGLPRKIQFKKLIIDPFSKDVAIHCEYSTWLESPTGEKLEETLLCYQRDNTSLEGWFSIESGGIGQAILSSINKTLESINNA